MTDSFDGRSRDLEEEYFHRKNQEAIQKLRKKIAFSEQAKATGLSSMSCPRCDGNLKHERFEEVDIDVCDKCGGIWVDSGELERLTSRERGWFGRWFSQKPEEG